jgi:ABC-type dipeptide/oligopeptide/nickel transport system permease subunit
VTGGRLEAPGPILEESRRRVTAAGASSRRRAKTRKLLRDPTVSLSLVVVLGVLVVAAAAPLLAPYGSDAPDYLHVLSGPTSAHWFGTDQLGRDLLTRLMYGTRTSLLIGFGAVALAFVGGSVLGTVAGYFGGWLDAALMRLVDLILAFPLLIFAILMVVVLGPSLANVILAVGLSQLPIFARLARALAIAQRNLEYIEAAHVTGAGSWRILTKHIWPNVMPPIFVQASSTIGVAILSGASLSFLGIGVQPPTADWGRMVAEFAPFVFTHPLLAFYPGLAIGITALAWNLLGDGLLALVDARTERGVL